MDKKCATRASLGRLEFLRVFDVPTESGRLTFGPRPRFPEELRGVDLVINLLTDDEIRELSLEWLTARRFPIPDRHCPARPELLRELLNEAVACLNRSGHVHIHCRAGIGRAGLVTACLLYALGVPAVWGYQEHARGVAVPDTPEQREWVECFRGGGAAANLDDALGML